jgi:hypothetical protein
MLAITKSVPMVARALNELGFVFINNAFRVFEFVVEKESLSESDGFRFRMPPRRKSQE